MSIGLSDIITSDPFYDGILQQLGYTKVFEGKSSGEKYQAIGYGVVPNEDTFTIKKRYSEFLSLGPGFHISFFKQPCETIEM